VQIYNGSDSGVRVARLCGYNLPNPIFLNTSSARLQFVSDSSVRRRGYDITYTSSLTGASRLLMRRTVLFYRPRRGPGSALGSLCVSVCMFGMINFEPGDV